MDTCARCDRDVDTVRTITPDRITEELVDSVNHGKEVLVGDGDMKVCARCMDELKGK